MLDSRAIAVEGVGYEPHVLAVQGFADIDTIVIEQPSHIGGGGSWWRGSWFTRNRNRFAPPPTREGNWPEFMAIATVGTPAGRSRLVGKVTTLDHPQSIAALRGRGQRAGMVRTLSRVHAIDPPRGKNDTTRIDQEAIMIMLAMEDDDE